MSVESQSIPAQNPSSCYGTVPVRQIETFTKLYEDAADSQPPLADHGKPPTDTNSEEVMNNDIIQPVFFDAKNRRWKRFKILCLTILTGLALVFGILVFSTVVEPRLPTLVLTSSQHLPDLPPATDRKSVV